MRGLLSEKEIRDRGRCVRQTGQAQATLHSRTGQQKYGYPSGKENLEKGTVAQSTPYLIQYGSQSRGQPSRFSTREERHSERQDKSARLDRRHISLVTYNSEIRESYRKERKTRRAYSKRAEVNFSVEARVDIRYKNKLGPQAPPRYLLCPLPLP